LLFNIKKGFKLKSTNKREKYRPYKRITQEEIELIFKLYEEKNGIKKNY